MTSRANKPNQISRKRAEVHRDCVHAGLSRDVATRGYNYRCLMTDEPSFGLATHESTGYLVCILQRHAAALAEASGELDHWKWVDSQYCLHLYDRFTVGNFHYFVTDPVVSGNVRNAFERNAPKDVTGFLRSAGHHLLSALRDIHEANLIHLDFDWSQVWIDAHEHLLLGGFHNLMPAKRAAEMRIRSYPAYAAPELLTGTGPYTDKADIWSVGVGILELLTGEWVGRYKLLTNANAESPTNLLKDIRELLPSLRQRLLGQAVDPMAADFLVQLLKYDPDDRPTAVEALRHPWFLELRQNIPKKVFDERSTGVKSDSIHTTDSNESEKLVMKPKVDATLRRQLIGYGYEILEELHSGRVSTIYRARCVFEGGFCDKKLAIKRKHQNKVNSGEKLYWQTMRHPAILELLDNFLDDSGHFYFVTELMINGNAIKFLRVSIGADISVTGESQLRHITSQVVEAFCYLHDNVHMVHLNFTWTNVLVDESGNAKLADFKCLQSHRSVNQHYTFRYGHLEYQSPETFVQPGVNRALVDRVDTWALGANLLELVCEKCIAGNEFNSLRHKSHDNWKTYNYILDNLVELPNVLRSCKVGTHLRDFIKQLLVFRPEVRMSAARAREHPWLASEQQLEEKKVSSEDVQKSNIDENKRKKDIASTPSSSILKKESKEAAKVFQRPEVDDDTHSLTVKSSTNNNEEVDAPIPMQESKETVVEEECQASSFGPVRTILIPKDSKPKPIHMEPIRMSPTLPVIVQKPSSPTLPVIVQKPSSPTLPVIVQKPSSPTLPVIVQEPSSPTLPVERKPYPVNRKPSEIKLTPPTPKTTIKLKESQLRPEVKWTRHHCQIGHSRNEQCMVRCHRCQKLIHRR